MIDCILALISLLFSVYATIEYKLYAKNTEDKENKLLGLNLTIRVMIYSILGVIIIMLGGIYGILPILLEVIEVPGSVIITVIVYTVYLTSNLLTIINCIKLRAFIRKIG